MMKVEVDEDWTVVTITAMDALTVACINMYLSSILITRMLVLSLINTNEAAIRK